MVISCCICQQASRRFITHFWIVVSEKDVCFTASLSPSLFPSEDDLPHIIVYDRIITNKGSGFNTTDGVFMAPMVGVYLFISNSASSGNDHCYLRLIKNGARVGPIANSMARNSLFDSGSMSVALELNTNDRLWIENSNCRVLYGGAVILFTGCKRIFNDKAFFFPMA